MEWRLILDAEHAGAWNMGVDEALLRSVAEGGAPTLRLYEWDRPWLSLGYRQRYGEAAQHACESEGIGIVRRVTGGQAVLHGADLTYAVVAPLSLVPGGLSESYRWISAALCDALNSLAVPAIAKPARRMPGRGAPEADAGRETDEADAGRTADEADAGRTTERLDTSSTSVPAFDCFQEPAPHEICIGQDKLAGSAQRRSGGALLQHGSIRVRPDFASHRALAGLETAGATSLREAGWSGEIEDLREACVSAFKSAFDASWRPDSLGPAERKYASERVARHLIDPLGNPQIPKGTPQGSFLPADR